MDPITTQLTPPDCLLLQKAKISKEIKNLKDFVQQYKNIPEMKNEIMDCLQSLQRDLQDIESSVQREEPPLSSNINGTNQHHGQVITQQNVYFGSTLNQKSDVVMGPNAQSLSCLKRKKWSKAWNHFTEDNGQDGKKRAMCKHCQTYLARSSKGCTSNLNNHLKSCPGLKNLNTVADKVKEESIIGPDLNGSDFVQRIIKYGLNGFKDDILSVYDREKCKFHEYIDKLPSRFSITIKRYWYDFWDMRIWFVDDSWELRNMIIFVAKYEDEDEDDFYEIMKSLIEDWNIRTKICSMFIGDGERCEEVTKNFNNWFNDAGLHPFIGAIISDSTFLNTIYGDFFYDLKEFSRNNIIAKAYELWDYIRTSEKFQRSINDALSMGKIVTCEHRDNGIKVLEWIIGRRESVNQLEDTDPDFKSINFTKEDWDDATLLYSGWKELCNCKNEIFKLADPKDKTVTMNFKVVCDIFFQLVQLRKSDNGYIRHIVSLIEERLVEYWKNFRSILEVGVILDPRCKLEMVKDNYEMIYENDFKIHFEKARDDFTKIFD